MSSRLIDSALPKNLGQIDPAESLVMAGEGIAA
jgi:hypothetical protein